MLNFGRVVRPEQPIGIFDSGIGGLTVAYAIRQMMPQESIVYFGDTAHLPYGDKSEAAIQAYSIRIADVLINRGCKVIVMACNSASSAAYELLREYVRKDIRVINVIDPMVQHVLDHYNGKTVGLIGTKRTIQSGVYKRKVDEGARHIRLQSLATPLLVPMIEEGFFNNRISHDIIDTYLQDPALQKIDALILGCTHYPLVRREISRFYGDAKDILDSSEIVAAALQQYLSDQGLLNPGVSRTDHFLVSDFTESFEASTKLFFREAVHLEKLDLWGN